MKKIKVEGTFLVASSRSEGVCRIYACSDGTHVIRYADFWTDEVLWFVRYSRSEYYLSTGIWYGGNHPALDRRVRITDFFPGWRISKLRKAYKLGVMV